VRLASQLEAHAKLAPYPNVAFRLEQLAAAKRKTAGSLREKISGLGERVEDPPFEPRSAKNHWERLAQDIADQKSIEIELQESAWLLAEQAPQVSEFLGELAGSEVQHTRVLQDLLVRADPQATQS
jgi:hypothetical protein